MFALYVDYSNAIDQDKLLHILSDLQFPKVAIDTIKDLCEGATTCMSIPAGITASIPVGS